jgi:hypothetical protein
MICGKIKLRSQIFQTFQGNMACYHHGATEVQLPKQRCCCWRRCYCRRQLAVFVILGIGLFLTILLFLTAVLNWPAPLKKIFVILGILLIFCWLIVVVFTAVLKVGSDG